MINLNYSAVVHSFTFAVEKEPWRVGKYENDDPYGHGQSIENVLMFLINCQRKYIVGKLVRSSNDLASPFKLFLRQLLKRCKCDYHSERSDPI